MQGKLVYANRTAQQLLGYSQEELQELEILDWIAPPYRQRLAEGIWQNRAAQPGNSETALVRKDGSWRYVRYSIQYLELEGQLYGAAIAHDITSTRQTPCSLEELYGAGEKLYASLELNQVMQALVDVCVDLLGADKSCIQRWDERSSI